MSSRVEWIDWSGKAGHLDLGVCIACSVRRLVTSNWGYERGCVNLELWDAMSLYRLLLHSPLTEVRCSKYCLFEDSIFPIQLFAICFPYGFVLYIEYVLMAKRLSHLCKHVDVKQLPPRFKLRVVCKVEQFCWKKGQTNGKNNSEHILLGAKCVYDSYLYLHSKPDQNPSLNLLFLV